MLAFHLINIIVYIDSEQYRVTRPLYKADRGYIS